MKRVIIALLCVTCTMLKPDYYKTLSVPKDATTQEIEKAYNHILLRILELQGPQTKEAIRQARKKALQEPTKELDLVELESAYSTLATPELRENYDAQLAAAQSLQSAEPNPEPFETSFKAGRPIVDWNFELRNRDNDELLVTVMQDEVELLNQYIMPGKKRLAFLEKWVPVFRLRSLDFSKNIQLILENPKKNKTYRYKFIVNKETDDPTEKRAYETVFVSFENEQVRPQKGTKGFTQSGLNMRKNIEKNYIIKTVK